jgi:hypothetical protein
MDSDKSVTANFVLLPLYEKVNFGGRPIDLGPIGCNSEHYEYLELQKGDKLELLVEPGGDEVTVALKIPGSGVKNISKKPARSHDLDYTAQVYGRYVIIIKRNDLLHKGHPCANYIGQVVYNYELFRPDDAPLPISEVKVDSGGDEVVIGPVGCDSRHSDTVTLQKGDKFELSVSGWTVNVVLDTPDNREKTIGMFERHHHLDYTADVDGNHRLTIERKDSKPTVSPCNNHLARVRYEYTIYRPGLQ